jgi:uncharacterized protein (TIGR02588 family)
VQREERRVVRPTRVDRSRRTSWMETLAAVVGLALVLLVLGYLLLSAAQRPRTPPDVVLRARQVVPVRAGWLVIVAVRNHGNRTAQSLEVTGELRTPGAPIETSTATLDYAPGRTEREVGLYFRGDPRAGTLELRPKGYLRP